MSNLVLELRQGEVMIVNGAPIRFRTKSRIELTAKARFLFGKQIMPPDQADSPARRIYFALAVGLYRLRGGARRTAWSRPRTDRRVQGGDHIGAGVRNPRSRAVCGRSRRLLPGPQAHAADHSPRRFRCWAASRKPPARWFRDPPHTRETIDSHADNEPSSNPRLSDGGNPSQPARTGGGRVPPCQRCAEGGARRRNRSSVCRRSPTIVGSG